MKAEWQVKALSEICEFQNGFAFKGNLFSESGSPILRISNIQDEEIDTKKIVYFNQQDYKENLDKYQVKYGDLLIAMSGATTGKIGFNNTYEIFYLNQRVGKFLPKESLSKQYLFYFLLTMIEESLRISAGSAQPNLSTDQIKNFKIPFTALGNQQRIVAILDQAFKSIAKARANAEQNLQNARALFESHLQSVFTQRGDGWATNTLCEVVELDKTQHKPKNTLPYVGMEDIESDTGNFIGSKEPRKVKSSTFHFNNNHVLYGRLRPYLNKVLLPDFEGHCSTEVFPILPSSNLNRSFLFYWLTLNSTKEKINATCTGARMPRANMNDVLFFEFSYPSLDVQNTIVQNIKELSKETQRLEALYQRKIACLDELKKSLLQQAFAGEL